jgi:Scramblase
MNTNNTDNHSQLSPHHAPSTSNVTTLTNAKDVLLDLNTFYIQQKPLYLENLTGCDQSNIYRVYKSLKQASAHGSELAKNKLFKCKEKSSFCGRNCIFNICRPFDMFVDAYVNVNGQKTKKPFLHLHSNYSCVCLCCKRPCLVVEYIDDGAKEILGYIKFPFTFCSIDINVHTSVSKKPIYLVTGNCCQPGLCMKIPCGPCKEVRFVIKSSEANEVIGKMVKVWTPLMGMVCDYMMVDFPSTMGWKDKCLILANALFHDFIYFEESNKNKEENIIGNFANHL